MIRLCALVSLLFVCGSIFAADRPNFVLINVDDLGYGDIGPFGSTKNRTPHLDQMAREGRTLTSHYAAPVCSPSRAALMTGCYPKRVLPISHVLFPVAAVGLNPDEVTIAERVKEQGYATACIGKWHLGDQPEFLPTRQGFDYFFGLPYSNDMGTAEDGAKSNPGQPLPKPQKKAAAAPAVTDGTGIRGADQPPLALLENERVIERVQAAEQGTLTRRYSEKARQFIRDHAAEPFFLYWPHTAIHFPLYPAEGARGRSGNGLLNDWVEEVDDTVGELFATLRELKLDDRTLVLFMSDNGGTKNSSNGPLRGNKGQTFEGGMRVPLVARWPGHVPAGTSTAAATSMIDLLPTFVSLAGGTVPADRKIDGHDISPLLLGAGEAKSPHDPFYYFSGLKLEAVRSGPWKLHLKSGELYDLQQDIGETKNVASDQADVVRRLRSLAERMDGDLGRDGVGPGCRALGRVESPQPLIDQDGRIRDGFGPAR